MVSPVTNFLPSIRIATSTPLRISGSPPLAIRRESADESELSLWVETNLPVITKPHAAAFTNREGLLPVCERQSPLAILSRINLSAVAVSGMRSNASARHINATPSWLESENSCINASTPLAFWRAVRTLPTNWVVSFLMLSACSSQCACSIRFCTRVCSSKR